MVKINVFEDFEEISPENKLVSVQDMKRKEKFSHLTFHGNPKRLISFIKRELEDMGYDVKHDTLDAKEGSFGDDVSDVYIKVYAEKRRDISGKIKKVIPKNILLLTIFGFFFLVLGIISASIVYLFFVSMGYILVVVSLFFIGVG